MSDIFTVVWSKRIEKELSRVPSFVAHKFYAWVAVVEVSGIIETRKSPGFHDEPLKGGRKGQRSIRLNRSYRAIYFETSRGDLELIEVIEVNKHEY